MCIQGAAYETVPRRLPFDFESLGEQSLKGFDQPVRAFAVQLKSGERVPDSASAAMTAEIGTADTYKPPPLELPDKPSIAVLPFTNLLMDRREDAIDQAQMSVKIDPGYLFNYVVLAAFAELERNQEASAAVEHLLRIDPGYSLRSFTEGQPFRDAAVLERHVEGLRKAGLPE